MGNLHQTGGLLNVNHHQQHSLIRPLNKLFWTGALAFALVLGGCTQKNSERTPAAAKGANDFIRIGEVGSMTGPEATFGVSTHQGIALAVKKLNEEGGIQGKQIKLFTLDDQSKPDEAATAVVRLITQNRVQAVLGEVASSRSLAMGAIAQDFKIPMISPSSTNPKVTEMGEYVFRVCFIDPFQGKVMAKFAYDSLKARKVAVLRDLKSDYSAGLADFFVQAFKGMGGEVLLDESYNAGDIDFKAQLTSIRAKKPDAIMVPGYYTEVGLIARQARELGINVPLLGGDGWDSPRLTEIGGKALNNSYFSNHYSNADKSPRIQEFIRIFAKEYGVRPDGLAAMGYDATMVLADSMKRAESLSPAHIRDAIASTKDFAGVTGTISINENRNAVKSAVVLKVENGIFKYQTTIDP